MNQSVLMTVFLCVATAAGTAQNRTDRRGSHRPKQQDQTPAIKELSELQLHQQAWYQETFLKKHSLAIVYYEELINRDNNRYYVRHSKWRLVSLYSRTGRFSALKKHMLSFAKMIKNRSATERRMVKGIIDAVDKVIESKRFEKLRRQAREAYLDEGTSPLTRRQARQKLLTLVRELNEAFGHRRPDPSSEEANAKRNQLLSRKRKLEKTLKDEERKGRGDGATARAKRKELREVVVQLRKIGGRRSNRPPRRDRYPYYILRRVQNLLREYEEEGKTEDAAKLKDLEKRLENLLRKGKTEDAGRLIRKASKDHPELRYNRRNRRGRRQSKDRAKPRRPKRKRSGD